MDRGASLFFLSQRTARWRWPWLLLGVAAAAVSAMAALLVLFLVVEVASELGSGWATEAARFFNAEDVVESVTTVPSLLGFELLLVGVTFWAAAVVGSLIQGRSIRSLLEPVRSFDWSIARKVLALQAILFLVTAAPGFFVPSLDRPDFTGIGQEHLIWLIPLAVLILIQTSGEDVFFKGYLLRQIGATTNVFWFAPVVVVLLFVSLHIGNPDVQSNLWLILPVFIGSELMAIYLTMRTAGMEVAVAWHWFNNATIFLLLADRTTQANDLTLFVFDDDPGTILDDAISVGLYAVFLVVQFLAFTTRRSPFFLEAHDWDPVAAKTTGSLGWDVAAPPPVAPPTADVQ